jgi:acyl carrier protein
MNDLDSIVYETVGRMCPLGPRSVAATDRMVDDLGYTSVNVIELVVDLELRFGVGPMSEETTARLITAGDVAREVEELVRLLPHSA